LVAFPVADKDTSRVHGSAARKNGADNPARGIAVWNERLRKTRYRGLKKNTAVSTQTPTDALTVHRQILDKDTDLVCLSQPGISTVTAKP